MQPRKYAKHMERLIMPHGFLPEFATKNCHSCSQQRANEGLGVTGMHRFAGLARWTALVAGVLFCSNLAQAQDARLSGVVRDAGGLPVAGATISVTNAASGVQRTLRTTESGFYSVTALDPGSYSVRVEHSGFKTAERSAVTLTTDTSSRADFLLIVGGVDQTVTVTDEDSALQTETAAVGTVITGKQYNDLPLVQQGRIRSPAAFIYQAPSVQGNYTAAGAENTSATNQFVVNGSQMQVSEFYLEGLAAGQMRTVGSFNESAPPVDAVREFKVTTTLLPADYGHTGSAAGFFNLKSGSNAWHGSVYEYFRNNALDAQPWGTKIPLFTHQNEFGATIGGPILLPHMYNGRNRSFFFFSYGGSRKSGVDSYVSLQVPTAAQLAGDFSGGSAIYDPSTTTTAGGTTTRTAFAGNKIPSNRIDPVAKALLQYFPQPNTTGTLNYSAFKGEKLLNPDAYTARVDQTLTSHQSLSVGFITTNVPRIRIDTPLPAPLTSGINQTVSGTTVRVNHNWVLSATSFNEASIGFNRFKNFIVPVIDQGNIVGQIGLKGLNSSVLPSMSFTNGYTTLASNSNTNANENDYQLKDVFSITVRSHAIRVGGEFRHTQLNDTTPSPTNGSIGFSNLETANPNSTATTGNGFASFLLGQTDSASITAPLEIAARRNYGGVFVQDDYKVTPKLTLNLGLRWEMQTAPTEKAGRSSIVSLTTANSGAGNLPGALVFAGTGSGLVGSDALAPSGYTAFGPRIGFAYRPWTSTVLRGGYGIYYSDNGLVLTTVGFQPQASFKSPNNGIAPAFVLNDGFPQAASLQPTLTPSLLNGQAGSFYAANAGQLPRTQEQAFGIQQAFSKNWSVQIDYVGTRNDRQINPALSNVNQVDAKYLSLGSLLTQSVTSSAAVAAGIKVPYNGFTGTVAQALRTYPQYLTLTNQAAKIGTSNYNSLQSVITKRSSYGLTINASYTFAKNLGYSNPSAYGGGVTNNILQNAGDTGAEYSLLPLDVRNAFVANWIYELPFGSGKALLNNRIANIFVGGWRISGVQRYQTGFPLAIVATNSLPIFNSVLRPNIVPGVSPATNISANSFVPGVSRRINLAAFSQPAAYTFGNARPTYSNITNFPVYSEDFAAMKTTQLTEKLKWNLYVQMFNAFNRHRFTSINTNFSNASFGQASNPSFPRYVQLGARFEF